MTVKMAILAGAAAAAIARSTPDMVWDSSGPHGLPPHRKGKFKQNARKAGKKRRKGALQ